MAESGIYEIVNLVNGKRYVGSAVDLRSRWRSHLHLLRKGSHHSPRLQRSFDKYGEISFEFRCLSLCAKEHLIANEQLALDSFRPEYNVERVAASRLGRKHSVETRAKMSADRKGKPKPPQSAEHRQKISEAQLGTKRGPYRPRTAEHCANIGAALTGKKRGPYGPRGPLSDEVRAKISAAKTGTKYKTRRKSPL